VIGAGVGDAVGETVMSAVGTVVGELVVVTLLHPAKDRDKTNIIAISRTGTRKYAVFMTCLLKFFNEKLWLVGLLALGYRRQVTV